MKKLILLLGLVSFAALAQDTVRKSEPVYLKTTPNVVVAPDDPNTVKPVLKNNEAPRKSKPVTEQKAKASANTTNQKTK